MGTKVNIEIQGQVVEAAQGPLSGMQIRNLSGLGDGDVYRVEGDDRHHVPDLEVLEVRGGERFILIQEDQSELHHHGRLPVPIEVDGKWLEAPQHEMTGAEIKNLAQRPAANRLYRIEMRHGRPFRHEIGDRENARLHRHECFITQPPVGKTS